jgi:ElaA protein
MTRPDLHATDWQTCHFNDLTGADVYAMLALRQQVFILEQTCLYPDADHKDQQAYHLLGWRNVGGERVLAAYLRCLAPGVSYAEASLGRVLTAPEARGGGFGRELLAQGLTLAESLYPGQPIRIGAQQHLEAFYAGFGFVTVSAPYDEDGIMHVEMLRG